MLEIRMPNCNFVTYELWPHFLGQGQGHHFDTFVLASLRTTNTQKSDSQQLISLHTYTHHPKTVRAIYSSRCKKKINDSIRNYSSGRTLKDKWKKCVLRKEGRKSYFQYCFVRCQETTGVASYRGLVMSADKNRNCGKQMKTSRRKLRKSRQMELSFTVVSAASRWETMTMEASAGVIKKTT